MRQFLLFMSKSNHKNTDLFLLISITIFVLVFLTGYVSDDFSAINNIRQEFVSNIFIPFNNYINIPVLFYTHTIFYNFININDIIFLSFIKFFYLFISFYAISKFFSIFTSNYYSYIISFLFIFWPTHDSTVYFFLAQYLMLSIALLCYAYYLLERNYFKRSIVFSFLGSFISYGSTPIALGLSILFILNKSYKKSLFILLPNFVYILYYVFISKILSISSISRIPNEINIFTVIKNYIIQVIALFDTNIGPSFFIKIYYSVLENNYVSLLLTIIIIFFIFLLNRRNIKNKKIEFNFNLFISLSSIIIIALLMFSITGGYYQTAFNLGNRGSIYSAFLISYLFVYFTQNRNIHILSIFLMLIVVFGISYHWKNIEINQKEVINNIFSSDELRNYNEKKILYVVGNQFSKLGEISNIEFFSESHVAESIFSLADLNHIKVKTLNNAFLYNGFYIQDKKYPVRKYPVDSSINIYDSNENKIKKIQSSSINDYITNLGNNKRHWVQFINNNYLKEIIRKYIPRLNYLF